jgi:anti-sigma-K factor RskA
MNHEKWLEMAEIYATGALDGRELEEFESHLAACSLCADHLTEVEDTLVLLPQSLTPLAPSAQVKTALMERIEQDSAPVPAAGGAWSWTAGFVLACMVMVLGAVVFQSRRMITEYETMALRLAAPQTQVVDLKPMEPSPAASARMLWDPKKCEGVFVAMGLSQLPPDKVYELWAIAGSEPIPAGTFTVDQNGCAKMNLRDLPRDKKIDKFAVTIEPVGGVPTPTGAMHLLGALAG